MTEPFGGRIIPRGQILSRPAKQPSGSSHPVAYELGNSYELDEDHCLLVASMDEQGGGDKCVGNDVFVFRSLQDIRAAGAIALNRPDPAFRLRTGATAWLAKYPAVGGVVPLRATLDDGSAHPAAGTGLMISNCVTFNAAGTSAEEDRETIFEFLQLRWDGTALRVSSEMHRSLHGFHLIGNCLCGFLSDHAAFLVPFCTDKGIVAFRFEFLDGAWQAVTAGEPFMTNRLTQLPELTGSGEGEPSIAKARGAYWINTRGTDPVGRVYRSVDGLNYELAFEHRAHTVPQVLNQGLDGNLYLATNPFPQPMGWVRNPLVLRPFDGDRFGEDVTIHDQGGIRDDHGDEIPFVDHAMASSVLLGGRRRHLLWYRVCDLKERTPHSFQTELKQLIGQPKPRSDKSGLYLCEIEYNQ